MSDSKPKHWMVVKHILRYHFKTWTCGVSLHKMDDFYDADWVEDKVNRHSQTRFLTYLGNTLFSWSSYKQPTTVHSSTKAEFRSITSMTAKLQWFVTIFIELGFMANTLSMIFCAILGWGISRLIQNIILRWNMSPSILISCTKDSRTTSSRWFTYHCLKCI